MRPLLAAAALLLLAVVPGAQADPIHFVPAERTVVLDTCMLTWPFVDQGVQVYYQPIRYGTDDPLPHADGVLLYAGAEPRDC